MPSYTKSQFVSAYDREYPDDFSREALELLYDYLNTSSVEYFNTVEFGTINDSYCEQSLEECLKDYDLENDVDFEEDSDDESEKEEKIQEAIKAYLENRTDLIGFTSQGVVYAFNFE